LVDGGQASLINLNLAKVIHVILILEK